MSIQNWTLIGVTVVVIEILAVISAIKALLSAWTSQGAIAWALALLTWPFISLPLFWIFGRNKFQGYVSARRTRDLKMLGIVEDVESRASQFHMDLGQQLGNARVLEQLAHLPFFRGNDTRLLILSANDYCG